MTIRYAALLRGINVGGHRRLPMADLRAILTELGYEDPVTHLQSGNAVFGYGGRDGEDALAGRLAGAIEKRFGFRPGCLVRRGDYLRRIADGCPFPVTGEAGRTLHVVYCSGPVEPERFAALDPAGYAPEEFRAGERALYLRLPGGLGRSRLAAALERPALLKGLVTTTRNWNTVVRLAELTGPDPGPGASGS
jgi:uncharacterized protein (DUF1697 family)